MKRRVKAEIYPNSPLVEVIFEIRFPGDPVIECKRDQFFNFVRKDYPKLFVPQINPQSHVGLEPYRFVREDESSGIMIALNRFAYYSKKYPGFTEFKREVLRLVGYFKKAYPGIDKLNRTGFRYVDVIPFTRENDCVPLHRLIKVRIDTPCDLPERYNSVSLGLVAAVGNGSITVRVENMRSADGSGEALLLDTDFSMEGRLSISQVRDYLEQSHRYSRRFFEDIVSDDFRMYLRGDTV